MTNIIYKLLDYLKAHTCISMIGWCVLELGFEVRFLTKLNKCKLPHIIGSIWIIKYGQ